MSHNKLTEVLNQLQAERHRVKELIERQEEELESIDDAIDSILKIVGGNGGGPQVSKNKTHVEIIEDILREHGKPMAMNDIVKSLSATLGREISRPSVETAVFRYFKKAGGARKFDRIGKGKYKYKFSK